MRGLQAREHGDHLSQSACTPWAMQSVQLCFFDVVANIQSDSSACLDILTRLYRRFQVEPAGSRGQALLDVALLIKPDQAWGVPRMILGNETWPLHDPRLLEEGHVYEIFLNRILSRIRSHFVIHAGVVARGGHGLILVGDSGHGKTTLVLELVRRGYRFLSDEIAALGRTDRQVHPFPRSLGLRPGTLARAGFPAAGGAPIWPNKWVGDIEEIQPHSMGRSAAISQIVILHAPDQERVPTGGGQEREFTVLVDRVDEDFLVAIRQLDDVIELSSDIYFGFPRLTLRAVRSTPVLARIEALCLERKILILDVIKRRNRRPDFTTPARLEVISKSQSVIELLRRFQGGHQSSLLHDDCHGDSSRLFLELAALVSEANCYELFVGPLHEMADLVCDASG